MMLFFVLSFFSNSVLKLSEKRSSAESCTPASNCHTCSPDNPDNCLSCPPKYGLKEGNDGIFICEECSNTNCEECNDDFNVCQKCKDGYYENNGDCSSCSYSCKTCYGTDSNCTSCARGQGLAKDENADTQSCRNCDNYCNECFSNYKKCTKCEYEYGLEKIDDNQIVCTRCLDQHCNDCKDDFSFCQKCSTSYGPVLNKDGKKTGFCQSCTGLCNNCEEDYTKCSSCPSSYGLYLNGVQSIYVGPEIGPDDSFTGNCLPCIANCKNCKDNSNICINCESGFSLIYGKDGKSTGKCARCPDNCASCTDDPSKCSTCNSGYFNENGKCTPLPKYCQSVTESKECSKCFNGFGFLIGSDGKETKECAPCPANCDECTYANECTECKSNYGKVIGDDGKETGQCAKCSQDGCRSCYNDYEECTWCDEYNGYKLYNGKCIRCGEGCSSCSEDGEICYYCYSGYGHVVIEEENGKDCHECGEGCNYCDSDYTSCTYCESGYGWVYEDDEKTNKCAPCPKNCDYCSNSAICDECDDGFGLNEKGACTKCTTANCAYCNDDYTKCEFCGEGMGLNEKGVCTKCTDSNCYYCQDDYKTCDNCKYGFGLNEKGVCTKCTSKNCEDCQADYTKCIECDGSEYYEPSEDNNYKCIKRCPYYCRSCNSDGFCTDCEYGYGKVLFDNGTETGTCESCGEHCQSCSSNSKICTYCEDGYDHVIENGKRTNRCQICDEPCKTCTSKPNECASCIEGYGLVLDEKGNPTGECNKCPPNCKYCDADYTICTKCDYEYGIVSKENGNLKVGQCQHCPKNCAYCNSDSLFCTVCNKYSLSINGEEMKAEFFGNVVGNDGYYTGSCAACLENCGICQDSSICTGCFYGFTLVNNKCEQCPQNCAVCEATTKVCSQCMDGFTFDVDKTGQKTGNCVSCLDNCAKCSNKNTCEECNEGFFVSKGSNGGSDKCVKCIANCAQCTNDKDCNECKSGFIFEDGQCKSCPNNCDECINSTYCEYDGCSLGYGILKAENGERKCGPCSSNCIRCYYANQCSYCKEDYHVDDNENSPYYHQCIPLIDNTQCKVDNCLTCVYGRPDECILCEPKYQLNLLNKCVEEPEFITATPMPYQQVSPDYKNSVDSDGNYVFDNSGNDCYLKLDYVSDARDADEKNRQVISSIIFQKNQNKAVEIPIGYDEMTLKVDKSTRTNKEIEVIIPATKDTLGIYLDSTSYASIETKQKADISIQSIDGSDINLDKIKPSASLTIEPRGTKISINEVEFKQEKNEIGELYIESDESDPKVQINAIKLQQERKGFISNAAIAGTVTFALRSSLQLDDDVDIENAIFDCPYDNDFSPLLKDNAYIKGELYGVPKSIVINKRNIKTWLSAQEKIIIAQFEDSDDFALCDDWASKLNYNNSPYNGYICEPSTKRLYVVRNEKEKNKLSAGAIAGIVIGCVVFVGLVVFLLVYFLVIRKRKKSDSSENEANDANDADEA